MRKLDPAKRRDWIATVRARKDELSAWKLAAQDSELTFSEWAGSWLNYAAERGLRGTLKHRIG